MKKTTKAVLVILSLLIVGSVYAQTPAPVAAPLDPAAVAASKELIASLKMREMLVTSMNQAAKNAPSMIRQFSASAINGNTKLNDAQKKEAIAKVDAKAPEIAKALQGLFEDPTMIDEMVEAAIPLYARNFTVDEIKQIAAFYKTPIGAKTLQVMPSLMNESMQSSQKIVMPRIAKLMDKMVQNEAK